VQKIIADLENEKYIVRLRVGRNNEYQVNGHFELKHDITRDATVGDLLDMLDDRRKW